MMWTHPGGGAVPGRLRSMQANTEMQEGLCLLLCRTSRSKVATLERSIASYFDVDGFLVEAPFRADVLRTLRTFETQQKKAQ